MEDPFAAIFALARKEGLALNNCFQNDDGVFRANWRRGSDCAQFVDDRDPRACLLNALMVAMKTLPAPAAAELGLFD